MKVGDLWSQLKPGIAAGFTDSTIVTEELMRRILHGALSNIVRIWLLVSEEAGLHAIITTTMTQDVCNGKKNLLLYSMYMHQKPSGALMTDAYKTLTNAARKWGCSAVVLCTQEPRLIEIAKRFPGSTVDTYLTVRL
jgi:hypothetical protein